MEDYVTFEQAKKLKELGFDWRCHYRYDVNKELEPNIRYNRIEVDSDDLCVNVNGRNIGDISAPTLSLAQKWLREVKGIDLDITVYLSIDGTVEPSSISRYYECKITFGEDDEDLDEYYNTYEQALSAGIDATLKLLK